MITRKLKQCKTCKTKQYLFSHGDCQSCWTKRKALDTNLKPVQARNQTKQYQTKAIKQVSNKRLEQLAKYRKERDTHLKEFPICQARIACAGALTNQIHHQSGKSGEMLFNRKYFLAVCPACHIEIERSPTMAKALGFSINRLDIKE